MERVPKASRVLSENLSPADTDMLGRSETDTLRLLFDICVKRPPVFRARMAAAVVDKRGRIVSIGLNLKKTNPLAKRYNPLSGYLHAEMDAILRARREGFEDWNRASLYVARARIRRETGMFEGGMAMPCKGCARFISDFNIQKVIHT